MLHVAETFHNSDQPNNPITMKIRRLIRLLNLKQYTGVSRLSWLQPLQTIEPDNSVKSSTVNDDYNGKWKLFGTPGWLSFGIFEVVWTYTQVPILVNIDTYGYLVNLKNFGFQHEINKWIIDRYPTAFYFYRVQWIKERIRVKIPLRPDHQPMLAVHKETCLGWDDRVLEQGNLIRTR